MTAKEYRIRRNILMQKIEINKKLKCERNAKHYQAELKKLEAEFGRTAGIDMETKVEEYDG